MIGCKKKTGGSALCLQFDGGYYLSELADPYYRSSLSYMLRYIWGSIVINDGVFVSESADTNYLFNLSYDTSNITINGGIFRKSLFGSISQLSGSRRGSLQFNYDYTYEQGWDVVNVSDEYYVAQAA